MCGIAGIYNFGTDKYVDENLIRKMCSVLVHRGPDDEGIYCKNNIGLGHRRLSIIDLVGGHQPMSNEDNSIWIIFNGEIYSFLQLKDELVKKGHIFRTRSDTEVILHLYEEEKEKCLDKLRGMFAFAIWDERNQSLFLARDRLGKKPLHYAIFDGRLIFASEIKAILQDPSVKREINYEALHDYLSLMYVPAPKTMFKGIQKLPAGHYLLCEKNNLEIKQYWDIDFSQTISGTEKEICDNIYSKLKEAVKLRLISDVPLGAFLSGGVDSSTIVSLMSQLQDSPVITNSIGFAQKNYNEIKFARALAKQFSTDHHEYTVESQAIEILDDLIWFYDEPFGDASAIPTYYVSKMARQNVKVALSGDGGDENFAGYDRYLYCRVIAKLQNLTPAFIKSLSKRICAQNFYQYENAWKVKLNNKLEELYLEPFELYFKIISMFQEEEKSCLYQEKLKNRLSGYNSKEGFKKIFERCESSDYVSKMQYLDIKTYLCDDILTKVDRASMANSLEVRAPILDHEFMEYVATIPSYLKLKAMTSKYIFKKTMSENLPARILNRPKMGFAIPMDEWLTHELRDIIEKELFDRNGVICELFNLEYVRRIWTFVLYGYMKGFKKTDFSYRIWLLFIFSRWFKKYIAS